MRGFLTRLLITALGLWVARAIVPGVGLPGWGNLLLAALLLGVVNGLVRPVLFVLTLPLTLLTLGLFLLVLNGITLSIVAWLMPGFSLSSLGAATVAAFVVTITSWLANSFVGNSGRIERWQRRVEVRGRRID